MSVLLFGATSLWGQGSGKLTGKILSIKNQPVSGAIVTVLDTVNVTTSKDGTFKFELKDPAKAKEISVWAAGYYPVQQKLNNRSEVVIMMMPEDQYKYNESVVLPFREEGDNKVSSYTSAINIAKKDFLLGVNKVDRALAGQIAGLEVKRSSGMPGEGSYYNLRGIRSLTGDNAPLIVINGVPYMPDKTPSTVIGGFTRDIFQAYNLQDIQNITVLKGAEAAMYGSMGSNGVILIQTDGATSNDLETKISYYGSFGVNWNDKRMPLLGLDDYKSYLSDVGLTIYENPNDFYSNFPFMRDPNDKRYAYLYNNNTDWQDLIYKNSTSTDHLFRVEGGDNIAKYDLSLGYSRENGLIDNTSMERFHTQLNTNILVSQKVNIFASLGLAYMNGHFQEQGMSMATNPVLAAYFRSPLLSPYDKDRDGNILSTYSSYRYGNSRTAAYGVSNPLALINTLDAHNRQYDLNMKAGISYKPFLGFTVSGIVGLYYNFNNEHLFIPGQSDPTILPVVDMYDTRNNAVKEGEAETTNFFLNLNGNYQKTFNYIHKLNAIAGWQMLTDKK